MWAGVAETAHEPPGASESELQLAGSPSDAYLSRGFRANLWKLEGAILDWVLSGLSSRRLHYYPNESRSRPRDSRHVIQLIQRLSKHLSVYQHELRKSQESNFRELQNKRLPLRTAQSVFSDPSWLEWESYDDLCYQNNGRFQHPGKTETPEVIKMRDHIWRTHDPPQFLCDD